MSVKPGGSIAAIINSGRGGKLQGLSQQQNGFPMARLLKRITHSSKLKTNRPSIPTRPPLAVYVIWHPNFALGAKIANQIYKHFRRDIFNNITGGAGVSVMFRCAVSARSSPPQQISYHDTEVTAVVALVDDALLSDRIWTQYVKDISRDTVALGFRTLFIPVAIKRTALGLGLKEQMIRWFDFRGRRRERCSRLNGRLSYSFSRLLRTHLQDLNETLNQKKSIAAYLEKVKIFISHSKHDNYGAQIGRKIRDAVNASTSGLSTFFDVFDIPDGKRFDEVIGHHASVCAMLAIHTDSYSSREWCRREIIEAKRHQVPLVVVSALQVGDERAFPYMGNVPQIRMDPELHGQIDDVIERLLDEVLKDYLWRARVERISLRAKRNVVFVPRPPELISLTLISVPSRGRVVMVYPDPPLSEEELGLFSQLSPNTSLRSMTEWVAGVGP